MDNFLLMSDLNNNELKRQTLEIALDFNKLKCGSQ